MPSVLPTLGIGLLAAFCNDHLEFLEVITPDVTYAEGLSPGDIPKYIRIGTCGQHVMQGNLMLCDIGECCT